MSGFKNTRHVPEALPKTLADLLRGYDRSLRRWILLWDGTRLLVTVGSFAVLSCLFDRFVDVDGIWRLPLPWIALAATVVQLAGLVRRLTRSPDYDHIAHTVDRRGHDSRDSLRSVLDFARRAMVDGFAGLSFRRATQLWQNKPVETPLEASCARQWAAGAALLIVVVAGAWLFPSSRAALLVTRFLDPTGNYMRPTATWFDVVEPSTEPLRSGDDLTIAMRIAGRPVNEPVPLAKITYGDGSSVTRKFDRDDLGNWTLMLKNVQRDFRWHVFMGPVRSRVYSSAVLPRPTIMAAEVMYSYPKYARLKDKTELLQGRSVVALAGTKVRLKIQSNVDLDDVLGATDEDNVRFRVNRRNPKEAIAYFILNKNGKLRISLVSTEQVSSKHETPYALRAIPDNAPSISLLNDMDGKSFYLTDTLDIRYRAQDDLGLSGIYVRAESSEARASENRVVIDLDLEKFGAPAIEGGAKIPVADLYRDNAKFLRISLLAKDTRDQDGLSRVVTIRIASDSFDRQLRMLRSTYEGSNNWQDPNRGAQNLRMLNDRVAAIRQARNQITILADSLSANTPPADNHARLVAQAAHAFRAISPSNPYGSFWFSDFQNLPLAPRFQELGEYAAIWSYCAMPPDRRRQEFEASLKHPNPKGELPAIAASLERDLSLVTNAVRRVHEDYTMVARELAGYLSDSHRRQIESATPAKWQDQNFAVNQKAGLNEVANLLEKNRLDPDTNVVTRLRQAANGDDALSRAGETVQLLQSLGDRLQNDTERAALLRSQDAAVSSRALTSGASRDGASVLTLAAGLYLTCDNAGADELFLLDCALRYLDHRADVPTPFRAPGAPDAALRERQAAVFELFDALMRLRADMEDLRLGVATGAFPADTPEREFAWLAVRESRLRLLAAVERSPISPSERQTGLDIAKALEMFRAWLPPAEWDPAIGETCRAMEARCAAAGDVLLPQVREFLRQISADIDTRIPLIKAAMDRMSTDIFAEIEYFRTGKKGMEFGNLDEIKVHLSALTMGVLKMLDFAELAMLYDACESANLPLLAATYVGLGHIVEHFEFKIEGLSWQMRNGQQRTAASEMWIGKVSVYEGLAEKFRILADIMSRPDALKDPANLPDAMQTMQIAHPYRVEMEKARRIRAITSGLQDRGAFVNSAIEAGGDVSPFWEEMYYRVHLLKRMLAGKSPAADVQHYAATLNAHLQIYGPTLPKALAEVPGIIAQCTAGMTANEREDLAGLAQTVLSDMQSLVARPKRLRLPPMADREAWIQHVDHSALARAKLRSTEQIDTDKRIMDRTMAGIALGIEQATPSALTWARGMVELNRRKAGLTLSRVGLGGVSLSGETVSVNLPEHIYLELRRAREGAMPPLFRDRCYEYLNEVLKKARE